MENEKSFLQRIDYSLIFILFLFAGISLIAIYSATPNYADSFSLVRRQFVSYVIGFIVMFSILLVDYRRLRELSIPFYVIGILLLVAVMVLGAEEYGAKRWIVIAGFFNFQPSEFVKVFVVIAIAHLLVRVQEKQQEEKKLLKDDLFLSFKVAIISIIPFGFILIQPDLGTALVLVGIAATMLLIAGISWRILFMYGLLGVGTIVGLVFLYFVNFDLFDKIIASHQITRIYGWLDPEGNSAGFGWQLINSLLAIGSGRLFGKGFGEGSQAQGWIPEVHTDFIFAIIGEEFGFIGASILISLYFILIYRLVQIALNCNDTFGSYLIAGIIGMIIFQVFQNIGMTIGLMPITGLPLPFISYGGSALLTNMIAMGIVLNISLRTKIYMFD